MQGGRAVETRGQLSANGVYRAAAHSRPVAGLGVEPRHQTLVPPPITSDEPTRMETRNGINWKWQLLSSDSGHLTRVPSGPFVISTMRSEAEAK